MQKKLQTPLRWTLLYLFFSVPMASHAIGAAYSTGKGVVNITVHRMALLWELGPLFWEDKLYQVEGVWELSAAHWFGSRGKRVNSRGSLSAFSTGPQLRWIRRTPDNGGLIPYLEIGVSPSWLSQSEIGGRRLDMHYQFEDRVGFGAKLGDKNDIDVNFRIVHYSNASMGKHNSGVNMMWVTVGRWF